MSKPPPSQASKSRRLHTPAEWADIRPILKHLYIDLDMTLREAMERIAKEHGFSATEQMYKMRLRSWGLSKYVKADEKEKTLAELLLSGPGVVPSSTETCTQPVRHDKLVRYAKLRAKCGALDGRHLSRVMKQELYSSDIKTEQSQPSCAFSAIMPDVCYAATIAATTQLPRSLPPPTNHANFDLFLRAMSAIIAKERGEYFTAQRFEPDEIFTALTDGMILWRNNSFPAARRSFGRAAHIVTRDLSDTVTVSRVAYCISSIIWGSGATREPVFMRFAQFMADHALEKLGPECPMTVVLQYIQWEQSIDAQLAIWACALDGYRVSEANVEHWWGMARRRWLWCLRSGMDERAVGYRDCAVAEVRGIGKLTGEMEVEARFEGPMVLLQ